jgi:hypothetical protein
VRGLAEFSRSLRKVDSEAAKGLRVASNEAADFLINATRPKMPSRTGAARKSLKARSTRTAVRVSMGGPRAPYVPWLDFGGHVGRGNSVRRPFIKEGRYLYPTFHANRDQFQQILQESLVRAAESAGLEVS